MTNLDGQVATFVEASELRGLDGSAFHGAGAGSLLPGFLHGFVQRADLAAGAHAALREA